MRVYLLCGVDGWETEQKLFVGIIYFMLVVFGNYKFYTNGSKWTRRECS